MIPLDKVKEIITKHDSLEKELASGNINAKKLVAYPENPNSFEKLVIDKNRFYLKVYYTKFNQ